MQNTNHEDNVTWRVLRAPGLHVADAGLDDPGQRRPGGQRVIVAADTGRVELPPLAFPTSLGWWVLILLSRA